MKKPGPRSASPVDLHVGTRIRMRRQLMNMSQEKLGNSLGVTFQQVQKYERGTNRVGASRLWDISRILDVPISFFYEGLDNDFEYVQAAEGDQMPIVYDFINSSDGVALARAISKIKSKAVRRQILELARSLADTDDDDDEDI